MIDIYAQRQADLVGEPTPQVGREGANKQRKEKKKRERQGEKEAQTCW